jgi:hypothetical protein
MRKKSFLVFILCLLYLASFGVNVGEKKEEIEIIPRSAVLLNSNLQPVYIKIKHEGAPVNASFSIGKTKKEVELKSGHNTVVMYVETSSKKHIHTLEFSISGKTGKKSFTVLPVRQWRVNFVQHTHTDIGYTRPQTDILPELIRFIDYALDYCDATDGWPDAARFRYTCEASWAVGEYLKTRPKEQIERLKRRVAEGRIEIAAMFFNFDEMPDEQTLAASLAPVKQIREAGLKTELAMQNDVNGIGWCFSEFFPDMGIKYVNMGTHGHKALVAFDKPTAFWWESPSGKKTLTFRAEHYHYGNRLCIDRSDFADFERNLLEYLQEMEDAHYPLDLISLQYSGYLTDNSPPALAGPSRIRQWNEKYAWPKLRSASSADFFREVEEKYADKIQTIRGAWPDWWNDGFGSGAREAAVSRQAHSDIITAQTALSMASLLHSDLPQEIYRRIADVNEAILFYDEHTFGSSESVRDPFGKSAIDQRSLKMSYAWEAVRRARPINEAALGLLQMYIPRAEVPTITVFNPHNYRYSGLAKATVDAEIFPRNKEVEVSDADGNIIPVQATGGDFAFWVKDLPPLGFRRYFIRVKDNPAPQYATASALSGEIIENRWYRIELNPERGTISRLFDKELSRDLVSSNAEWQLGEFVHEELADRKAMDAYKRPEARRKGLEKIRFDSFSEGAIWDTWKFRGETSTGIGEDNYKFEIRVYKTAKRIDFVHRLRKKIITDPESIYISFPFEWPGARIFYDVPGGTIEAGVDQIPGSSNDWNTVQNFATLRSSGGQIVMGSPEIPLMQFGGFNCGRFQAGALPESTTMYSWPMNNYWVTNFNGYQHSEFEWSYFLTSAADSSIAFATRFAWGARIPLPVRVLPAGNADTSLKSEASTLEIIPENLLLINMRPLENERAILMQLREIGGRPANFDARSPYWKNLRFEVCDANAAPLPAQAGIAFRPWESKFIKIIMEK